MHQGQVVPKEIQMEFYRMSRQQLQYLYEYVNEDQAKLYKLLSTMNQFEYIESLIEKLKQGQLAQLVLEGQFKEIKRIIKGKEQKPIIEQVIAAQPTTIDLPLHILVQVMDFLDYPNLNKLRRVSSQFNNVYLENSDIHYKKFCLALFTKQYQLPIETPFSKMVTFINNNIHLYEHQNNLVNQINNDVQDYIWQGKYPKNTTADEIIKSYSLYKDAFMNHPRINYCGLYAIRESYLKRGEAEISHYYAPCHIVEFNRYVRFWDDGSVTMLITVSKPKRAELVEFFSMKEYKNNCNDKFTRGEYIVDGDLIFIQTFRHSTVFQYTYQIKTNKKAGPYPCNILVIKQAKMHMLGDNYTTDLLRKDKQQILFYKYFPEMRKSLAENSHNWKYITY